jgi:hypothetical protein
MTLGRWGSGTAAAALFFGIVAVVEQRRERHLAEALARATKAGLQADSLQAAADSTRVLYRVAVAGLGDSLRVAVRRAVQEVQRADVLDKALRLERVTRDKLRATIAELRSAPRSDTVQVVGTDGERRATFDVRQAPYTVRAEVSLPAAPGRGRMDVRVKLDTLALDVHVGCGAANAAGVRAATAIVVAPKWASVRLGSVEQAPRVCAVIPGGERSSAQSVMRAILQRVGVSVGYGATRTASGTVVSGVSTMVGITIWP